MALFFRCSQTARIPCIRYIIWDLVVNPPLNTLNLHFLLRILLLLVEFQHWFN